MSDTYTPLIYSHPISERFPGFDVYLKLETFQPPQSFKYRSQGAFAREALDKHGKSVHLVIASGGNAAVALAHAAHTLGVQCTVFVTADAGKNKILIKTMEDLGAHVVVGGVDYAEALKAAEDFVKQDKKIVMAPAYDHPTLWRGASSIITEISEQLPNDASPPEALLCSVGGGSLIGGVMIGCEALGWNDTRVIALETQGANVFYNSILSNPSASADSDDLEPYTLPEGVTTFVSPTSPSSNEPQITLAKLSAITSRATSLGASTCAPGVVRMALERRQKTKGGVTVVDIPDELSMRAALDFADEHKLLVELASSTTLTPAYAPALFDRLFASDSSLELPSVANGEVNTRRTLVFIVCGGFKISLASLAEYHAHLEKVSKDDDGEDALWDVGIEGEVVLVSSGSVL